MVRGLPDFSRAEWPRRDQSALQAVDKDIFAVQTDPADYTDYKLIDYTVPSGKTLYVAEVSVGAQPTDLQNNLQPWVMLGLLRRTNALIATVISAFGVCGVTITFTKPKRFGSGDHVILSGMHGAGATLKSLHGHVGGWEE